MNGWGKDGSMLNPEERNTLQAFSKIDDDVIYMCEASGGELLYGIERSRRKEYNMGRFQALMLAVPPIPVTRRIWRIYGQTKAGLQKVGKTVPDIDLLIASTARFYNLVFVTNDKHMKNLPDSFVCKNWSIE
jgi:predicted nucleic acid-binding protein